MIREVTVITAASGRDVRTVSFGFFVSRYGMASSRNTASRSKVNVPAVTKRAVADWIAVRVDNCDSFVAKNSHSMKV